MTQQSELPLETSAPARTVEVADSDLELTLTRLAGEGLYAVTMEQAAGSQSRWRLELATVSTRLASLATEPQPLYQSDATLEHFPLATGQPSASLTVK